MFKGRCRKNMSIKMNIPFSPPDIGEEEIKQVIEALKSGWITTGPKTKQFEREIKQEIIENAEGIQEELKQKNPRKGR